MTTRRIRRVLVCQAVLSLILAASVQSPASANQRPYVLIERAQVKLRVETPKTVGAMFIVLWMDSDGLNGIEFSQSAAHYNAAGDLKGYTSFHTSDGNPFDVDELAFEMDGLASATLRGTYRGEVCTRDAPDLIEICENEVLVRVDVAWKGTGPVTRGDSHLRRRWASAIGTVAGLTFSTRLPDTYGVLQTYRYD